MPFKADAYRRHHIPKQRQKVTNRAEYDAACAPAAAPPCRSQPRRSRVGRRGAHWQRWPSEVSDLTTAKP